MRNSGADSPTRATQSGPRKPLISRVALIALLVAVAVQLIFIASYVGALHDPKPHNLPIGVAAPPAVGAALVQEINTASGHMLNARLVASAADLQHQIKTLSLSGGIVVTQSGIQILTASATNFTASSEFVAFAQGLASAQHQQAAVIDLSPLRPGDSTGLTSLYLVIGWVFGGYFLATILTTIVGFKQWSRLHSALRLAGLALSAAASGVIGTLIARAFDAVPGADFWAIAGIGTLLVFAVACATAGLQSLIGMYGTQVALIAFILLGNPSSGGIAAPEMLPGFWRSIGPWLPNSAGYTLVRNTLYFGSQSFGSAIPVLCIYMVAGAALLLFFGSSRIALYTPKVDSPVDALRASLSGAR